VPPRAGGGGIGEPDVGHPIVGNVGVIAQAEVHDRLAHDHAEAVPLDGLECRVGGSGVCARVQARRRRPGGRELTEVPRRKALTLIAVERSLERRHQAAQPVHHPDGEAHARDRQLGQVCVQIDQTGE
jgi:hypothetical protein